MYRVANIFNAIKCFLGFHNWSNDWPTLRGLAYKRKCLRCPVYQGAVMNEGRLSDWSVAGREYDAPVDKR